MKATPKTILQLSLHSILFLLGSLSASLFADWPRHRGDAALTGRADTQLGNKLDLQWTYATGEFLKSSVVVENGFAYVGSDDGRLHAINLATGKTKWTFKTEMAIEAPPLLHNGQGLLSTDGFLFNRCTKELN